MSARHRVSRRRFIQVSAFSAASAPLLAGCARLQPSWSLSPQEFALVEAIADQVIPPDQDPGGKDAGVARFIERQLRGPYRRFAATYHRGLALLDETSRRLHATSFVSLPFDRRTALLLRLERDDVPDGLWTRPRASQFFALIADHCMQGYYGSPRHGGNRDVASWKMLGLDYPQVAGRVTAPGTSG